MLGFVAVVDEAAVPGGGAVPGAGWGFGGLAGGTGAIESVVGLVDDVVVGLVGGVVVGLVGDTVVGAVGDGAGLVGDEVGFGFGFEFGLYGCAVGVCALVPCGLPEGADDCATAALDSAAATAKTRILSD